MSNRIRLHRDILHRPPRRYSTLTLGLFILAVMGWGLALWLLFTIGGA